MYFCLNLTGNVYNKKSINMDGLWSNRTEVECDEKSTQIRL